MARFWLIALALLVCAVLHAHAQQPVLAIQSALTLYNARVAAWTSPTTV